MGTSKWYAPDQRIRSESAARLAIRVSGWVADGRSPEKAPDELALFRALHVCAYRATPRSGQERVGRNELHVWCRRWHVIRDYLIEKHLGLAYATANRFRYRGLDSDDVLGDAMVALTRAVDRFNPWRGYRFSTYACSVIGRAIVRRGNRERQYRAVFPIQHQEAMERPAEASETGADLYVERLNRALDGCGLSELESKILAQRFPAGAGERRTFQEIGDLVGLSKERVRQIQNLALAKLRRALRADPVLR